MAPVALPVVEGLDPNALAMILQFIGASPMAVGLFFGLWLGGRAVGAALRLVLDAKADTVIRAIVGLSLAIKNATNPANTLTPIPQERRQTTRGNKRTGSNPTAIQGQ